MAEYRIYAACLASYNSGVLHGRWIDADQDADAIRDEIAAMLRESPYPNVRVECPTCGGDGKFAEANYDGEGAPEEPCDDCNGTGTVPSGEEYAIHDYEGFGTIKLGEHPDIDTVAEMAAALDEHGEAFEFWYANDSRNSVDVDSFRDDYQGCYDSLADYAEQFVTDCYSLRDVPDFIKTHIDYEGIGRDFELGGDIWTERGSEGVHVFRNS
jgi:antirestriction protein